MTRELTHIYRGGYWECKERQDWVAPPFPELRPGPSPAAAPTRALGPTPPS